MAIKEKWTKLSLDDNSHYAKAIRAGAKDIRSLAAAGKMTVEQAEEAIRQLVEKTGIEEKKGEPEGNNTPSGCTQAYTPSTKTSPPASQSTMQEEDHK